jgi:hypothetical protein
MVRLYRATGDRPAWHKNRATEVCLPGRKALPTAEFFEQLC